MTRKLSPEERLILERDIRAAISRWFTAVRVVFFWTLATVAWVMLVRWAVSIGGLP